MLREFFDNEAVYLDGRVWDGADFGARGGRLDTFPWGAELESAPAGTRALARAGDEVLVVGGDAPHRVSVLKPGGELQTVAGSLDGFIARLLPRFSDIPVIARRARELLDQNNNQAARRLLEPVRRLASLGMIHDGTWRAYEWRRHLADVNNMWGVILLRDGDKAGAEDCWRATEIFSGQFSEPQKNLAELYRDQQRLGELKELASSPELFTSAEARGLAAACWLLVAIETGDAEAQAAARAAVLDAEPAHAWLELLRREAERPGAAPELEQILETIIFNEGEDHE